LPFIHKEKGNPLFCALKAKNDNATNKNESKEKSRESKTILI
jgi:hypothetical protein